MIEMSQFDLSPGLALGPFVIPLIAAAIKGAGSFFGNKSKQKKESALASEQHRSGVIKHNQAEDSRLASLRTLQAAMAGRGINLPIDPAAFNRKEYAEGDPRKVAEAGRGSAFWGSLLGGVGDIGLAYGQSQQMQPTSAGQPVGPELPSEEELQYMAGTNPETAAIIRQLLESRKG